MSNNTVTVQLYCGCLFVMLLFSGICSVMVFTLAVTVSALLYVIVLSTVLLLLTFTFSVMVFTLAVTVSAVLGLFCQRLCHCLPVLLLS